MYNVLLLSCDKMHISWAELLYDHLWHFIFKTLITKKRVCFVRVGTERPRISLTCLKIWDSVVNRPRKVGQILVFDVVPNFVADVPLRRSWRGHRQREAPHHQQSSVWRGQSHRSTGVSDILPTSTDDYRGLHYGSFAREMCSFSPTPSEYFAQCLLTRERCNIKRREQLLVRCLSILRRPARLKIHLNTSSVARSKTAQERFKSQILSRIWVQLWHASTVSQH